MHKRHRIVRLSSSLSVLSADAADESPLEAKSGEGETG